MSKIPFVFFPKPALLMFFLSVNVMASIQITPMHNLSYHRLTHSTSNLLRICYVPGTVLGTWDKYVQSENPCPGAVHIPTFSFPPLSSVLWFNQFHYHNLIYIHSLLSFYLNYYNRLLTVY